MKDHISYCHPVFWIKILSNMAKIDNEQYNRAMKYIEHAKEGWRNLYFSKLRSVLALLGVLVGTASVVAMVMGGQLATNEALKQFKSLGTDLLAVSINMASEEGRESAGKAESLSLQQVLALQHVNPSITHVAPYTQLYHPVAYAGHPVNGTLLGVTDSFAEILRVKLQKGRFVASVDNYAFYCVIGQDVYAAMKEIAGKDPIGQSLQIGKNMFVVVCVAE